MGIELLGLDLRLWLAASNLQATSGLMTNDAILAATALDSGIADIASADRDFERVAGLTVHRPTDLPAP